MREEIVHSFMGEKVGLTPLVIGMFVSFIKFVRN